MFFIHELKRGFFEDFPFQNIYTLLEYNSVGQYSNDILQ